MIEQPEALKARIYDVLETVMDPGMPILSIVDLGMVRSVETSPAPVVTITPTYIGCAALLEIVKNVRASLSEHEVGPVAVEIKHAPPWSSDWVSERGRAIMRANGIAPPPARGNKTASRRCPACGSGVVQEISAFGSSPCMSLWRCLDCREPFGAFKCH